jgi:SAM-dependent methyltransferase
MNPRPTRDGLRALYTEHYFESDDPACGYPVYEKDGPSLREKAQRLLPALERHGRVGALLDVGCAYGFTLEVARERGWTVQGIEPAQAVGARVAERLGVPVAGDLTAAALPTGSFDAVTLWDVIEHLPDPRATLGEVRRILRPGGLCSVVTPDVGSLAARVLGSRWEEKQKMPEHIYFFSRRSLTRLLDEAGFTPLEWGTVGKRMTAEETLTRLRPAAPWLFGPARAIARVTGTHRVAAYFDPRWKMSVVARVDPQ